MSWKALAQRKFAQGAYIPPANTTSTTPERRAEPQPSTSRDTTNIVLNNVSAKTLLDNVSLKGPLSSTLQPKVLLDRLPTADMPKEKVPSSSPSKMVTRSKTKKLIIHKKKDVKSKKRILKRLVSNISNKSNNESNDFNTIEDNTPLTHFLKNTEQKPANIVVCGNAEAEQPVSSMEVEPNIAQNEQDVNTSCYYSHQEIQKWLADSISEEEVTEEVPAEVPEDAAAKVPEEIPAEVSEEIPKVLPAAATHENVQQAEETEALNKDKCNCNHSSQVLNIAFSENIGKYEGYHKCEKCCLADKLKTLSRIYDTPPIPTIMPYYVCDSNTDETQKRPELIRTNDQPLKNAELSSNKGDLYMNVLQFLRQLIQTSTDTNGILHAKLVPPTTEAYPINNASFIENKNLINQVVASLASNSELLQVIMQLQNSSKSQMDPPLVPVNDNHSESSHSSQNMKLYLSESSENADVDNNPISHASFRLDSIHLNPTSEFPTHSAPFVDNLDEIKGITMLDTDREQRDISVPDRLNEQQDISRPNNHNEQRDIEMPDSHNEQLSNTILDSHNEQKNSAISGSHNEQQDITMQDQDSTIPASHNEQQHITTTSYYNIRKIPKIESPLTLSDDDSVIECTEQDYTDMEVRSVARSRHTATPFPLPSTSRYVGLQDCSKAIEAPVFYPTNQDFQNPIAYFEKILPEASKFGLCKVVSPRDFKPPCNINNEIRFKVVDQYIPRLFSRWGPASKEMCAFRAHLATEKVKFTRAPLLDGMEVNLPKLYNIVQQHGVVRALTKKLWGRIAEEMALQKNTKPNKKIEQVYLKCLLPYRMLSDDERQNITQRLEVAWSKKHKKMMKRSMNPLHRKNRLLGDSESSEEDTEEKDLIEEALADSEDCVVPGRTMSLFAYKKIAKNTMSVLFPKSSSVIPLTKNIEAEYWRLVTQGQDHLCINTASIDTGAEGYGFPKDQSNKYSKHPWNLKMLSQNSSNVLRFLGSVLGVTVPTLHLGMVFSTSCWHRDPHGLPWVEYMHEGPGKIWYGIPNEQSSAFRNAVSDLCPTVCQNKSVWLPSDVTMIPPNLLLKHNVSLSRVEQHPGEFIIVFPKAYSCSISTGYTVSESVYFATASWLDDVHQLFNDLKNCCEPTMFSLEKLLVAVARDERAPVDQLKRVRSSLVPLIEEELNYRNELKEKVTGLKITNEIRQSKRKGRQSRGGWNLQEQDECEICRSTLFFAKVVGLTANNTFMCLEHAIKLVNRARLVPSQVTLITKISDQDLETLIKSIEKRLTSAENRTVSRN
ncbi:hypothetical protein K1T71_000412 [Dendrolimus kikuchii]|uniref:Uncharacterized protein n=1 Tax=Dendrolimus kikuchii TaxID=765133 RepID=A0ACC1DJ50_9NEOP|nr:hypothetical protein K1T71_000412 [Dendrolimus kikuchii]